MHYVFLFSFLLLMSCNNQADAPLLTEDSAKPDGTELNDTAITLVDTSSAAAAVITKVPEGFYTATLPCDGCKGIAHTILFQRNKTYRMEDVSLGKTNQVTTTTGPFNPAGGIVWAYKGQVVKARYSWSGDTLFYLLPNKRIAMQKQVAATENDVWRKKGREGIAFYGVGNEPFWNIEIHRKDQIVLHQAEWTKPVTFSNINRIAAGDSIIYTAASDTSSLKVIINNRFCSDGMSDFRYTHSIRMQYNDKVFTGCGMAYQ
jgi:uncharacterized membrane protein